MKYYYTDHPITFPDSFSITDEHANILFQVDTKLNWGRIIKISKEHQTLRILDDKISTYFPSFTIKDENDHKLGCIKRIFSFKAPQLDFQYKGYYIHGDYMTQSYDVAQQATTMATIKHISQGMDKVEIDILKDEYAIDILTFVIALEAHKALF